MSNRLAFAAAGAVCALFAALPASAAPALPAVLAQPAQVEMAQHRPGPHAHRPHHVRKPVCHLKKVKAPGHHGRPVYKTVRVCR